MKLERVWGKKDINWNLISAKSTTEFALLADVMAWLNCFHAPEPTRATTVSVPESVMKKIENRARRHGVTKNRVVNDLIRKGLDKAGKTSQN